MMWRWLRSAEEHEILRAGDDLHLEMAYHEKFGEPFLEYNSVDFHSPEEWLHAIKEALKKDKPTRIKRRFTDLHEQDIDGTPLQAEAWLKEYEKKFGEKFPSFSEPMLNAYLYRENDDTPPIYGYLELLDHALQADQPFQIEDLHF